MSETPDSNIIDQEKIELLNTLSFLHSKLLVIQFYPEEFIQADKALKLIIKMAEQIDNQLKSSEVKDV